MTAKKQWLCSLIPAASLVLDDGACTALRQGKSLLPVGIVKSDGRKFERGDIVACQTKDGAVVAQGLVNYNSDEAARVIGKHSSEVKSVLGAGYEEEMIHRDNLAVVDQDGDEVRN